MNKYIRTDDGRIIDTTKERETNLCNQRAWCPEKGFVVYENDIIKQANTIEELCDEFVVVGYSICEKPMLILGNQYPLKVAKNYLKCSEVIYGSIWVDGNLIKVAKLNDKGELELL